MISFVLAADAGVDSLISSVVALGEIIETLENQGEKPSTSIVPLLDRAGEIQPILSTVEGATVLSPRRDVAMAWQLGLEVATNQLLWLGAASQSLDFSEFLGAVQVIATKPSYLSKDGWMLAHKGALVATGGPGRFSEGESISGFARTLVDYMPEEISPTWGSGSTSPGFAQAEIDITHPSALEVGEHSYIGMRSLIRSPHSANFIRIGKYCSMSGEVQILALRPRRHVFFDRDGERVQVGLMPQHAAETATTYPINLVAPDAPFTELPDDGSIVSDPLIIGNDVWVGWGARIVGPLVIGDGAVISAGSVVLGNVPPYSVVAGNPATVIRTRFSKESIERLSSLRWWDWPDEKVKANWWWFTQPVKSFLDHFESETQERELHA